MQEGWYDEDYWILCETLEESMHLTREYGIEQYLPGFRIVGLKGWDDFVLVNSSGDYFCVPTVPLTAEYLEPLAFPTERLRLEEDERYLNRLKWYVQPLAFGGDATDQTNIAWLALDAHIEAVRWWNEFYYQNYQRSG